MIAQATAPITNGTTAGELSFEHLLTYVLQGIQHAESETLGPWGKAGLVLTNLALACIIGKLIGSVYRRTYTGTNFDRRLMDTHMLLCLGGALIWSVVGEKIAYAFGLAGMVGLIRYRTTVRDPKDTTILLFSMILGMACGLGQYPVAIIGTAVVLSTLKFLHYTYRRDQKKLLADGTDVMQLMQDDD